MTRGPTTIAAALALVAALSGCGGGGPPSTSSTPTAPPAPGPIIGVRPAPHPQDPLSSTQRREATSVVRRFLSGYLSYLYGRADASRVAPVTASVEQALRSGSARVTPAQRRRRPRVAGLTVTGQTPRSALAVVQVADGGPAAYQLTLTIERRAGSWVISDLGDDG